MIEKDRPGGAGWATTPLLGHLPGDAGTKPRSSKGDQRRPGNQEARSNRPCSPLVRILAYVVAGSALVPGLGIVVTLAAIQR
jgi:hypothetical protein